MASWRASNPTFFLSWYSTLLGGVRYYTLWIHKSTFIAGDRTFSLAEQKTGTRWQWAHSCKTNPWLSVGGNDPPATCWHTSSLLSAVSLFSSQHVLRSTPPTDMQKSMLPHLDRSHQPHTVNPTVRPTSASTIALSRGIFMTNSPPIPITFSCLYSVRFEWTFTFIVKCSYVTWAKPQKNHSDIFLH